MPKSIEDIDRQIAALKEQKKRQQAQIAQKKREGLRSCKELIGEEVVNAFDNWTSIDLDLFAMYISEHADEIVTSCSTSETDLDDALKRNGHRSACDPVHQAPSPTRHSPGRHCSALMQGRSFPVQVQLFLSNHQVSNKRHLGKNRSALSIEPFFSLARR